eukprot:6393257-Prymnesium_polylepis.1
MLQPRPCLAAPLSPLRAHTIDAPVAAPTRPCLAAALSPQSSYDRRPTDRSARRLPHARRARRAPRARRT